MIRTVKVAAQKRTTDMRNDERGNHNEEHTEVPTRFSGDRQPLYNNHNYNQRQRRNNPGNMQPIRINQPNRSYQPNRINQPNRSYQPNRINHPNRSYQPNRMNQRGRQPRGQTNVRPNNQVTNDINDIRPLQRTAEDRYLYAQNIGTDDEARNISPNRQKNTISQMSSIETGRYIPVRNYEEYWDPNYNKETSTQSLFKSGNEGTRRPPQEFHFRDTQASSQGRNQVNGSSIPLQSRWAATENRLGRGDRPSSLNTARDLMQEEYEIQAAEYAAKEREKQMKKLQEKMMRLRYCSAFDLGHRLSDNSARDLSPESRDRMANKLQEDYNKKAKEHANKAKELEEMKEAVERAKKLEKLERTTFYKDTMSGNILGSDSRPNETTGAVPKQRVVKTLSKEDKPKLNVEKTNDQDYFSKDSQHTKSKLASDKVGEAVNILTRSSNALQPEINQSGDFSKFTPSASDNNLREARRKMQEKLDLQLQLKKQEEGFKKTDIILKQQEKGETMPSKSTLQKPSTQENEIHKIDTIKSPQKKGENVILKPIVQNQGNEIHKIDTIRSPQKKGENVILKPIVQNQTVNYTDTSKSEANKDETSIETNEAHSQKKFVSVNAQNQDNVGNKLPDKQSLSVLDQLTLRASRLNKEYEAQYGPPQVVQQKQSLNMTKPQLTQPEPSVLRTVEQIIQYDKTGAVLQSKENTSNGKLMFNTLGYDCYNQPVLKLRPL